MTCTADHIRQVYEDLNLDALGLRATSASDVYKLVGTQRKRRAYHPTGLMHDALDLLQGEWPFSCAGNLVVSLDNHRHPTPGRMDVRVFARLVGADPIILVNSASDFGATLLSGGYAEHFANLNVLFTDEFTKVSAANLADVQALTKLAWDLRSSR